MDVLTASQDLTASPVLRTDISTVVVRDDQGNPIYVAQQHAPGVVWTSTPADSNFAELVQSLGLTTRLKIIQ